MIPGVKRSLELLLRWSELSSITDAIMRTHPGSQPESSAQVGVRRVCSPLGTCTLGQEWVSSHRNRVQSVSGDRGLGMLGGVGGGGCAWVKSGVGVKDESFKQHRCRHDDAPKVHRLRALHGWLQGAIG